MATRGLTAWSDTALVGRCRQSLLCIDLMSRCSESWEDVASMCEAREGCCAAAVGDSIYVMGGKCGDVHLRSCERYE